MYRLLAATSIGDQVLAAKLESKTDPLALALALALAESSPVVLTCALTMLLTQYSWFPESIAQTAFRRGLTTYRTSYNSRT